MAGRISPDGRRVALVRAQPADAKVFVVGIEGGEEVTLARGQHSEPLWSPDGKRLFVLSDRRGQSDLWSIPVVNGAAGGPPEFVKDNVSLLLGATRDGQYYYNLRTQARDLFVAEIDPKIGTLLSTPEQITSRGLNAGAAWSPDGDYLAYYAFGRTAGAKGLSGVIRSNKSREERDVPLKEPLAPSALMPQWFPDSRSLFVHSYDGKLRRLAVQTGESRLLLDAAAIPPYKDGRPNSSYNAGVILSPAGRTIYSLTRDDDGHHTRILRRDLDGGAAVEMLSRWESDCMRSSSSAYIRTVRRSSSPMSSSTTVSGC